MFPTVICLDLETTGLDPAKSSIVSIGAVNMADFNEKFYTEFTPFPGAEINSESMKVHKLTLDYLYSTKRTHNEGLQKFYEWIDRQVNWVKPDSITKVTEPPIFTPAGYCVAFDYYFLNYGFQKASISNPLDYHLLDLFAVYFGRTGKSSQLDSIARKLELPKNPNPHNALEDALITAKCLKVLMPEVNWGGDNGRE